MPWTYQWHIGYSEEAGTWSKAHGYNGAFIDRDDVSGNGTKTGKLDWINQFGLRFYVDHAADKGLLHLWDGNKVKPHLDALHGTGVRPVPLNDATTEKLKGHLRKNIAASKSSPNRAAYALDDEPSWGHFVHPTMWRMTEDLGAYQRWLAEVYGEKVPKRARWISYDDIRPKLATWAIRDFDASPLMDQWTYNDAQWVNLLGELVTYANQLDPDTPVGIVGGQSPNAFGGYDYARLMRKIQFIEAYNIGSSQAVIRSFNPGNALPAMTTHFHKSVDDTIWQMGYYLAHGNRGHIGWVEKWFDGKTPKPWHKQVAPAILEAGQKIGPLMHKAKWIHDGVAMYYSHPSIQLGWILDAEAHGKTWVNRNNDHRLSGAAHVRHAWENMLRDSGVQYDFVSYIDVIQRGVPEEYKVLILPATLCLSDVEARRITEFCERGGVVIADYLPGLWDQHGKGRERGGVLDDLFGVTHDPGMMAADVFGERLWAEVNQDANYYWKTYEEFLSNKNTSILDERGFHRAVREMRVKQEVKAGVGRAVLMNLSPQWYNAYRSRGGEVGKKHHVFIQPIKEAGVRPWVRLKENVPGYEITYWSIENGRVLLFVCQNPEVTGSSLGGGNAQGLKTDWQEVTLRFRKEVSSLRDERRGVDLGDGDSFPFKWKQNETLVLSFDFPGWMGK